MKFRTVRQDLSSSQTTWMEAKMAPKSVDLGLSDVVPVRFNFPEEDVEVGDMCWHVLSVEELGQELSNDKGDNATTQGRFIQTQFQLAESKQRGAGI